MSTLSELRESVMLIPVDATDRLGGLFLEVLDGVEDDDELTEQQEAVLEHLAFEFAHRIHQDALLARMTESN